MAGLSRKNIRDIFAEAVELEPSKRESFVHEACGGDARSIEQVNGLLKAYAQAGEFLSEPSVAMSAPVLATELDAAGEVPGTVIGPYKLLQLIGEGGFGCVYMAEQERPVRRRIALKIIKLGMDTRQVIARFEAERQALAMMDHANIAKVLDAGATEHGRPYFAMELVKGERITEYCDRHNMGMRERLELFVQVCHAVQHAHQKGIIHRDIKPSNVLVTVADGKPIPKVIDFGIAKATASRLTEKTLFTEFRQLIGTPEYMSPEQAEMSGVDIDTRSDIYSLGVLLYELLTGFTPFDSHELRSAAFGEMQRIIREVEPDRPSTRLSRLGNTLASVAAHRHTEPAQLRKQIAGDLDSIVMKCLEKDRTRRYETANGLVRDIDRFMRNEPVEATPPSLPYRMRKFTRRHRGPVVAAAIVTLTLFVGLALAILGMLMATAARDRAQLAQQAEKAAHIEADGERLRANQKAEQLRQELYITQIVAAQRILDVGGNEPVKPLLAQCDQDLRGWEWDRMNWLADRSDRTLQAHTPKHRIGSAFISFSPDDRRFLTTGEDDSLRIWDADSMQLLQEFSDPDRAIITTATYSKDGALIALGTATGKVHVVDAESGQPLRTVDADKHWVRCIAIDPSNARLAIGALPELTVVCNVQTGDREFVLGTEDQLDRASALQFSADGSRLLIGSLGNAVGLVDMGLGRPLLVERGAGFVALDAALSPDESRIASVGLDARLWMRDAQTAKLLYSVSTGASPMNALTFHPSGDFVACAGDDGVIAFFDAYNGERLGTFSGHEQPLRDVCFDGSGRWLISLDSAGVVKRWHLGVREPSAAYSDVQGLRAATFSADGGVIYVGAFHQGPIVLNASSFESDSQVQQPFAFASVGAIVVSPNGEAMAVSGAPVGGDPWGVALCDRHGTIRHRRIGANCAAFSSDSNLVAVCTDDHTLTICDVQTGQAHKRMAINDTSIAAVCWDENDRTLIVGCADGTLRQVDADTGESTRLVEAHSGAVQHVVVMPQHRTLVTSSIEPPSIKVWEWPSTHLRFELTDSVQTFAIAVSPDGRRLITGGSNKTVSLWDMQSGRRITNVGTARATIRAVAFSPNGRTIIACGDDHSLRAWETFAPTSINLERRFLRDAERHRNRRQWLELDRHVQGTGIGQ